MLISANIHYKDIFRANWQLLARNSKYRRDVALLFAFVTVWLYFSRHPNSSVQWGSLLTAALGITATILLVWLVLGFLLVAVGSYAPETKGSHQFEITAEHFIERNTAGERTTKWAYVLPIEVLKDYVLVRMGTFTCHVVPATAFCSRREFEEFSTLLLEHKNVA